MTLAAVSVVGPIGFASYRRHVEQLERETLDELAAIRTLKVEHVQAWRERLKADAELVRTIPALIDFVGEAGHGHGGHLETVIDWIRRNYEPRGYRDIRLLMPSDPAPEWDGVPALVRRARAGDGPHLSQFFEEHEAVRLTVVAPVARRDGRPSGFVLLLTVDPSASLTPAIRAWPSPSRTAEAILVRRDGDEVVFLNELRHWSGTALRLRRRVTETHLPAVRLWVSPDWGPGHDTYDYRGVRVLAAGGRIPGSDWAIVTKVDAEEVYAPLRSLMLWTWVALGAVLAAGVATAMWQVERRDTAVLRHAASARLLQERFALAVKASGVAFWDWDVAHNTVYFSPEYKAQLGYAETELEASFAEWESRLHPEDRARAVAYTRSYASTPGEEFSQEFRLRHRDGTYRHILARAEGQFEDGRLVRLMGCHIDLTHTKQLESQFRQAQKMEAVGRLAGGIAHDFNNLLTAINGYTDLLLMRQLPPEVVRDLVEVQRAGGSAARLTRQLLVFSRHAPENRTLIDLNAVLHDWHRLLGRTLGDDIVIRLELQAGAANVIADQSQVEQALMNLAVNARDAMPEGGHLVLRTERCEVQTTPGGCTNRLRPGDYWVVQVEDSGTGIPESALPHIFEPFFTTKGPGKGTGLGLAMVYGVATSCGGGVCVRTSTTGTTFSMFLPAAPQAVVDAPGQQPRAGVLAPKRVLVVDDDPAVRGVISRIVTAAGHSVEAVDAAAALAAIRSKGRFDVLLTDVLMPGMSGTELARHLTTVDPGLRVVFMTGFPGGELVDRLPPGTPVVRKPPSATDLRAAIDSLPPNRSCTDQFCDPV